MTKEDLDMYAAKAKEEFPKRIENETDLWKAMVSFSVLHESGHDAPDACTRLKSYIFNPLR
jgi:hypothetical protein